MREFEYRLEARLAELERRRGSDPEIDYNDEERDKVQQHMMPLTPQPPRRRNHRRNKTNELTSIYRGEKGNVF